MFIKLKKKKNCFKGVYFSLIKFGNLNQNIIKLGKINLGILNLNLRLRTMNWLDPRQGYISNLNKLLGAVTDK